MNDGNGKKEKNINNADNGGGKYKTNRTRMLALSGLFAAFIMLLTLVKLPVPGGMGYIHLGDAVIFAACILIGWYAIPAAALGSALADLLNGYAVYMIPTAVIKGIMALIVVLLTLKNKRIWMIAVAFTLSSLFMQGGYILFEYLFAGLISDGAYVFVLISFLVGLIQSVVGIPLGIFLTMVLKKIRIEYGTEKQEP